MAPSTHRPHGTDDSGDFTARIAELAGAQVHAQILFTASNAAIFDLLEEPRTAGSVARRLGWSERGTRFLLNALVGLGLLRRSDDAYQNTGTASACLHSGSPACQREVIGHAHQCSRAWNHLEEAVRKGYGLHRGLHPASSEELRRYAQAMYVLGLAGARDTFQCLDLEAPRHMLDLGGGAGAYTATALSRYPGLRVTLFERPAVAAMARERLRAAGQAERCQVVGGDFRTDPIGAGYDLVLVSNVLHGQGPEPNRELIQRCYESTAPGGLLVIRDFLTNTERTHPAFSALFSLHMLVHTEAGRTYSVEDVAGWTDEAGYVSGRLLAPGRKARLWVVRRRGNRRKE